MFSSVEETLWTVDMTRITKPGPSYHRRCASMSTSEKVGPGGNCWRETNIDELICSTLPASNSFPHVTCCIMLPLQRLYQALRTLRQGKWVRVDGRFRSVMMCYASFYCFFYVFWMMCHWSDLISIQGTFSEQNLTRVSRVSSEAIPCPWQVAVSRRLAFTRSQGIIPLDLIRQLQNSNRQQKVKMNRKDVKSITSVGSLWRSKVPKPTVSTVQAVGQAKSLASRDSAESHFGKDSFCGDELIEPFQLNFNSFSTRSTRQDDARNWSSEQCV